MSNLRNNFNSPCFMQFRVHYCVKQYGQTCNKDTVFHFNSIPMKFALITFLQSMKQVSNINTIKFPIIPTSKLFYFFPPIGFNRITSLLHYRLLIRFLFLNEYLADKVDVVSLFIIVWMSLSNEQYVTPSIPQGELG